MANLVNLENISLAHGAISVFTGVSAGISAGERIGVIGINGGGKSSLLNLIAGHHVPDTGRISLRNGLSIAYSGQFISYPDDSQVMNILVGDMPEHQWRSDPKIRAIFAGLGIDPLLDRMINHLSGGQRRRISLAAALIQDAELILLDEPTNHLDIDAIAWLAQFLIESRRTLVFVTHDRWFLDHVATRTWEVTDGILLSFEGGYNDWIFARAERERRMQVVEDRRANLARKELAWLRRGAPARTSKPRYRIAEAEQLIAAVPEIRNSVELVQLATRRLGKVVIECENLTLEVGDRILLKNLNWNLAPGARIGIIGANGSGKTTLLHALAKSSKPSSGTVKHGKTIHLGWLKQELEDIPSHLTVLEAIDAVASTVEIGDKELTASQIGERLGFTPALLHTSIGNLSGGQKRRLQLSRIMMDAPNVLLLDEPTNDLDIDALQKLEDLLDSWAGTLIVISHDQFLLERICDDVYALYGNGLLTHLPAGITQYFRDRPAVSAGSSSSSSTRSATGEKAPARNIPPTHAVSTPDTAKNNYEAQKNLRKLENQIEKLSQRRKTLQVAMDTAAADHGKLMELSQEYELLITQLSQLEEEWLALAELV